MWRWFLFVSVATTLMCRIEAFSSLRHVSRSAVLAAKSSNQESPKNHDNDDDDTEDQQEDPQVQRKKKKGKGGGGYKPLDNRDQLPFRVQQVTPDPYIRSEIKKQQRQERQAKTNTKTNTKAKAKAKREPDLLTVSARLKLAGTNDSDSSTTVLGEFPLDKSTTSGDIISGLGDGRTYKVVKARCQYKYVGGQRFVMVRKILEVKELTRAIQEAQLEAQLSLVTTEPGSKSSSSNISDQSISSQRSNGNGNNNKSGRPSKSKTNNKDEDS